MQILLQDGLEYDGLVFVSQGNQAETGSNANAPHSFNKKIECNQVCVHLL